MDSNLRDLISIITALSLGLWGLLIIWSVIFPLLLGLRGSRRGPRR